MATPLEATPAPVPHLRPYMVHRDDLKYPEYYFCVPVNFALKQPGNDPLISHFKQILTALLNTSGGVIVLVNHDGTPPKEKDLDTWTLNLPNYLSSIIPHALFRETIDFITVHEDDEQLLNKSEDDNRITIESLHMLVKKSSELITYNSHLYTRFMASTKPVHDQKGICKVLEGKIGEPFPFRRESKYEYGSVFIVREEKCIEFKCWKVSGFDVSTHEKKPTYMDKLLEEKILNTVVALANSPRGGYLMLGVNDKTNKILGQHITEDDERKFREFLKVNLRTNEKGILRWGSLERQPMEANTYPIQGTEHHQHGTEPPEQGSCPPQQETGNTTHADTEVDWTIEFIPVEGGKEEERLRLIIIQLSHIPGGVFAQYPESYYVNEEGLITQMTFNDWKSACTQMFPMVAPSEEINVTESESPLTEHGETSQIEPNPVSTSFVPPSEEEDRAYREDISYPELTSDSKSNLDDVGVDIEKNIQMFASNSGVFNMTSPMNFTPSRETIVQSLRCKEGITDAIEHIEDDSIAAFGIASSLWTSNCKIARQLQGPEGHVLDVFVMKKTGSIKFHVVIDEGGDEEEAWNYAHESARMTKRCMLYTNPPSEQQAAISCLWVECHVFKLRTGALINPATRKSIYSIHSSEHFGGGTVIHEMKCSLARVLMSKRTRLRSCFGDDLSIALTADQMEKIMSVGLNQFNHISGPPGSGKTYMALYLYQMRHRCIFLVSTMPLKNFLVFQGVKKDDIFVMSCKNVLNELNNKDFELLLVDDAQNIEWGREDWNSLFEKVFKHKGMKLVVFGDSIYQQYKEHVCDSSSLMYEFCHKHNHDNGLPMKLESLTKVHRNTQTVVTFMKTASGKSELVSTRREVGDDIQLKHLEINPDDFGPLLDFVKSLSTPERAVRNVEHTYEPREIAILVDQFDDNNFDHVIALLIRSALRKYHQNYDHNDGLAEFWNAYLSCHHQQDGVANGHAERLHTDFLESQGTFPDYNKFAELSLIDFQDSYGKLQNYHPQNGQADKLVQIVHDAGTFPVTGYTVDTLENFTGFDRKVCILVTRHDLVKKYWFMDRYCETIRIKNPKYITFVASRGISKVVFITTNPVTDAIARHFKVEKSAEIWRRLWHLRIDGVDERQELDLCCVTVDRHQAVLYIIRDIYYHARPQLVITDLTDEPGYQKLLCKACDSEGNLLDPDVSPDLLRSRRALLRRAVFGHDSVADPVLSVQPEPTASDSEDSRAPGCLDLLCKACDSEGNRLDSEREDVSPDELRWLRDDSVADPVLSVQPEPTASDSEDSRAVVAGGDDLLVRGTYLVDDLGFKVLLCIASDPEGNQVVVAGGDDVYQGPCRGCPYRWAVYELQPARLHKRRTFKLDTRPDSLSWIRDRDIIIVTAGLRGSVARLSTEDGSELWRYKASDINLSDLRHVSVSTDPCHIYVADYGRGCVLELCEEDGLHVRDIPTPDLELPQACEECIQQPCERCSRRLDAPSVVCTDSTGQRIFVCTSDNSDIFLLSPDIKPKHIIRAKGIVTCMRLKGTHLVVGIVDCDEHHSEMGISMYDVSSLVP